MVEKQTNLRTATSVPLDDVLNFKTARFEASTHGIDARSAIKQVESSGLDFRPLHGDDGLSNDAHNAFRFKRIYVNSDRGTALISSSDIIKLQLSEKSFVSNRLTNRLEELLVAEHEILISCSGTIGNVALSGKHLANNAVSQHVLRVRVDDKFLAGYISAFLRSRFGRPQLTGLAYGSVITHLEPSHLEHVIVPVPDELIMQEIGSLMLDATAARDQANVLLDKADNLLHQRLQLPNLSDIYVPDYSTHRVIGLEQLQHRFEGGFHSQIVDLAERALLESGVQLTNIGDDSIASEIWAVTKFRKRVYVRRGGIPMLNSKQLFQYDPISMKSLAKGAHRKDIDEIQLKQNLIVVTCSGTVGKVQIIPKYMSEWTASQDAHRLLCRDDETAGYVFTWLNSDYGQALLKRFSYGSVILHIDIDQLSRVTIPQPGAHVISEIGNLVLQANSLRDEAWNKERQAIEQIESLVAPP